MGSNSRTLSNSMGLVLQGQTIAIMAKEWIMVEVMAEVVHEIAIPTLIKILRVMVEVVLILGLLLSFRKVIACILGQE